LRIGSLIISSEDLLAGLVVILRFTGFIAVLGLTAASLSESEITRALESLLSPLSVLHIPIRDFVMAVQVTLRFLPLLAQTAERIAKAQASRGANWQSNRWNIVQQVRQIIPIIVPLFVSSLRKAEAMALAMDARGYGSLPIRTSVVTLKYHLEDGLVLLGGVVACLIFVLLR
jgi:energy-coupling factor transport system permease protein